jgi:glyoxylate carboligase
LAPQNQLGEEIEMNTATTAGRRMPTYRALAQDLKNLGVDTVFGLMSDDTALFAVEIDTLGIAFYGGRHENNAIAMAEGYAYTTGKLGIAIIGRGPAAANGLHAAVSASRTGSKVLIIYGEMPVGGGAVNVIGPDYKAFNARDVMAAAGLQTFPRPRPRPRARRWRTPLPPPRGARL